MTIQMSTSMRNARLDAIETAIGTGARVQIFTGSAPASCAASEAGTLLVDFTLASDWAANASAGAKAFNNLPISINASATGTAAHFRIYDSTATTCHYQGTVTITGGGGDMTVDNTSIASGQSVSITSFTITEGNA